jgi:GNAT superfamily N-acetyltransferase
MATVRPLRENTDLCAFFIERFKTEWPDWYGPDGPGDAETDLLEFANPAGALPVGVIALADSGSPVGIAALKAMSISTHPHLGPWAVAGYVIPSRRREGIGAGLLSALVAEAERLGFDEIYCATASAVSLLERAGWSLIETVMHDGAMQHIFERVVQKRGEQK